MGAWPLPTGDSPHASLGRLYTRSIMQHASCGHSSQFARDRTGLLLLVRWASVNFHAMRALVGGSFGPVSFGLARAPSRTVAAHPCPVLVELRTVGSLKGSSSRPQWLRRGQAVMRGRRRRATRTRMQRSAAAALQVWPGCLARQSRSSSHRIRWRSLQIQGDVFASPRATGETSTARDRL